jgi:hypothetical protein
MKKWLKRPNSTPFGFMPAGPRLTATEGARHTTLSSFSSAFQAEEKEKSLQGGRLVAP